MGDCCINSKLAFDDKFVVIDINGIHQVSLDYCSCTVALGHVDQILQAHWYLATTINPKCAATFNVLEYFQLLMFKSKASIFQYYHSLEWRTDNTGVVKVLVHVFLVIYQHSLTLTSGTLRIIIQSFYVWFANGVILKCLNELAADMTLQVLMQLNFVNVQLCALHAHSQERIFWSAGMILHKEYSE